MTGIAIDALLAVAVLSAWLGCVGFARLREPLDRLHCVAFVNATASVAIAAAALFADGLSIRALKILLVVAVNLVGGAALSHVVGRAIMLRALAPDTPRPAVDRTQGVPQG